MDLDLPPSLYPQLASIGLRQKTVQSRSRFTDDSHVVDLMAERWEASITWPPRQTKRSGVMEVLQNQLAGGVNVLRLHHPARPLPRGTLRGTPLLQLSAAAGTRLLVVTVNEPGMTVEPADMLGVSGQLFQVAAASSAAGSTLVVETVNRVRRPLIAGAAVIWTRPTARFRAISPFHPTAFRPGSTDGGVLDLEEVLD